MAGVVVVEVSITKIHGHIRVDVEHVEHAGDVAVQINVCKIRTMETHPMELIGWRISSMNQDFMPSFQLKKDPVT